jgi:dienelactone hydrolase
MKAVSVVTVIFLALGLTQALGQENPIPQTEYAPPSGKGRVVVMISGQSGPTNYIPIAKDIAKAGYYVVLVDGNDIWKKDGEDRFKGVVARAQQSPQALPGKVGVVGFSLGGGPALAYAANEPDLVAAVVVGYPLTNYITDPTSFVAHRIKVPTVMLAAVHDADKNCCMIDMARKLAAAAKAGSEPFELTEYPNAKHGFNLRGEGNYREQDAADAFARTLAHLKKYLAPPA